VVLINLAVYKASLVNNNLSVDTALQGSSTCSWNLNGSSCITMLYCMHNIPAKEIDVLDGASPLKELRTYNLEKSSLFVAYCLVILNNLFFFFVSQRFLCNILHAAHEISLF
jgi:hypothetical protein